MSTRTWKQWRCTVIKLALAYAWLGGSVAGAEDPPPKPFVIRLDDTGIAEWSVLNPRKPKVLKKKEVPKVVLENRTLNRSIDVLFPASFAMPQSKLLAALDDLARALQKAQLLALTRKLEEQTNRVEQSAKEYRSATEAAGVEPGALDQRIRTVDKALEDAFGRIAALQSQKAKKDQIEQAKREAERLKNQSSLLDRATDSRKQLEADQKQATAQYRELVTQSSQLGDPALMAAVAAGRDQPEAITQTLQSQSASDPDPGKALAELEAILGRPLSTDRPPGCREVVNRFGTLFLSSDVSELIRCARELAARLGAGPEVTAFQKQAEATCEFFEAMVDGDLTPPGKEDQSKGEPKPSSPFCSLSEPVVPFPAEADTRFKGACKENKKAHELSCERVLTVLPGGPGRALPFKFFDKVATDDGRVVFTVRFTQGVDTPGRSTGYLAIVDKPGEPANVNTWRFTGSVGGSVDPAVGTNAILLPALNDGDKAFDGDQKEHLTGSGNLKLTQKIASWAEGTATLGFKKGDLGEANSDGTVRVPQYSLSAYWKNGVQVAFGKYDQAAPGSGIAINESGEGFEFRFRQLSVGNIIRRESKAGKADADNQDSRVYLTQYQGISLGRLGALNLIGLYGREDKAKVCAEPELAKCVDENPNDTMKPASADYAYEYGTVGGEMFFGHQNFSGRLAAFASRRSIRQGDRAATATLGRAVDGEGKVALLELSSSERSADHTPMFSYSLRLGYGTGDDPATPDTDEGYIGETAGFSPGQLFLPVFAGRVGNGTGILVAPGLSNKSYAAFVFTDSQHSPLKWLDDLFRGQDEVAEQSSTFRLHRFWFNEPVFGSRKAGYEAEAVFTIEVPKGVKWQTEAAYFFAQGGLDRVLKKNPWQLRANLTISL